MFTHPVFLFTIFFNLADGRFKLSPFYALYLLSCVNKARFGLKREELEYNISVKDVSITTKHYFTSSASSRMKPSNSNCSFKYLTEFSVKFLFIAELVF